jgi:hypothetical protein
MYRYVHICIYIERGGLIIVTKVLGRIKAEFEMPLSCATLMQEQGLPSDAKR